MSVLVFVIGKPGSGKTTLIKFFIAQLQEYSQRIKYLTDRDVLLAMACRGQAPSLIQSIDDNNFIVVDDLVYEVAIQSLQSEIKSAVDRQILLIEFSRRNYSSTFTAMEDLLNSSKYLIIYLSAPFDICKNRNTERAKNSSYLVPLAEMERYFSDDDLGALALRYPNNIIVLNSNTGVEELRADSTHVLDLIRSKAEMGDD